MRDTTKVAIVGAGDVGATIAYVMSIKSTVREVALINRTRAKAEGEAMDINHGVSFAKPMDVYAGGYEDCKNAKMVIITAGAAQEPGQTRLDLAKKNTDIVCQIADKILEHEPNPILFIVTNPVDVITYAVRERTGLGEGQVIGAGTVLDSSRFRYRLSEHCNLDPRNVHAHIVGEHGDSEVPAWSRANVSGIPLDEYCPVCGNACELEMRQQILQDVRDAAYRIIERKGSTYYGIGQAATRVVEAVVKDQKSILTVSTTVQGYYGINDVALSLPSVLGTAGVEKVIHASLSDSEVEGLRNSAKTLRESLDHVGV